MYTRLEPGWIINLGINDYFHSLGLWWMLYSEGRELNIMETPTFTVGEEVQQLERLRGFTHQGHQAHDLAILRSHPDQQANLRRNSAL